MKKKSVTFLVLLTLLVIIDRIANAQTYVDLGLPSGTLWADRNVGAASPEDYGDYFAWGETTTKSGRRCSLRTTRTPGATSTSAPATWIPTIGAAVAAGSLYVPCDADNYLVS